MNRTEDVAVLERTTLFQGYFRIDRYRVRHRLFRGGFGPPIEREVFERGQAVGVLPYDPAREEVVLIEQFRIGPFANGDRPWMIETVAGIIDAGETAQDVAIRELREEADLSTARPLIPIGRYYTSPGCSTETIQLYCALIDATKAEGFHGVADENEDIRIERYALGDAIEALNKGAIASGPAVISLQWLALNRDRLRTLSADAP
jgi:ADP-ribose pyrophosphatase